MRQDGFTPLHMATGAAMIVVHDRDEDRTAATVQLLIRAGLEVNARDRVRWPTYNLDTCLFL